jgi:hypothetical protein
MQSHGRQVRHSSEFPRWCDDVADSAGPARFARRSRLKAAVLGRDGDDDTEAFSSALLYTVIGKVLDVSPQILVLETDTGEQRFPLSATAKAWRGGPVPSAALRQGDHAIVRRNKPGSPVVERIWAEIGRVTGTVIERDGPATLLVDEGPAKGRRIVIISASAAGRIEVRFPRLEPGYLIDVIGLRHDGYLEALTDTGHRPAAVPGGPSARPAARQRPRTRSGQRRRRLARAGRGARRAARARVPGAGSRDKLRAHNAGRCHLRRRPACGGSAHRGPGLRPAALPVGGQHAPAAQRLLGSGQAAAGDRVRSDRQAVLRSLRQLRDVTARPDRGPDHGCLRGARRQSRRGLLQRDDDDRRLI